MQVAIAIYKLATYAEFRVVACVFGIGISTVHKCLFRFVRALNKRAKKFIYMPTYEEARHDSKSFEEINHIPQIIGCIGGCHIPILPPSNGYRDFVNRKYWPSYVLQAVVGFDYRFLDVSVKFPGSAHDAWVFRNSGLYRNIDELLVKVAWMHFEQSAILTVHNHVITRNPRISVSHDKHDKHKTFFLHINNVQEEDKGRYMCQINTVTAKTQFGYLHVVVPPNIDDSITSSDVVVREGSNVTLKCRATGSPVPSIKWKRDDSTKITINKNLEVLEWEGEVLELIKISRLGMGAYLCIASNGVPPSVSKRIKVSVDFPPMLWIPHQLVGIPLYYNITLECYIEAHPTSLNYWTRENSQMIHDSNKYKTETVSGSPSYKSIMRLTITNVQHSDYGIYKCVAKNPRGDTDGTIRLYSSNPPTTQPPPTTETAIHKDLWGEPKMDFNNSYYGQTSTNPVHLSDKGSKYQQSNLNDIDRSEHKSFGEKNRNHDWTTDTSKPKSGAKTVFYMPTSIVILLVVVIISINALTVKIH